MTILVFSGLLSVPSAVFAEASWYGSMRGGLQAGGGGSDAQFFDGGSRWGVKGSAEASEGLTAVYRFESKVSTTNAGQPGGRLAYAGLSGGFGTVTLGQIWNAAYNHAGAITDKSFYFGDAGTGYRHGNALSYAFSSGAVSFQMDLISDGGMDSGKAIDKAEFGMTFGLGEVGKIAIAHTSVENVHTTKMENGRAGVTSGVTDDPAFLSIAVDDDGKLKKTFGTLRDKNTGAIVESDTLTNVMHTTGEGNDTPVMPILAYSTAASAPSTLEMHDDGYLTTQTASEQCEPGKTGCNAYALWVSRAVTDVAGEDATHTYNIVADSAVSHTATAILPDMKPGSKSTHVAVEFGLGGITSHLGYSESKMNGATAKSKTVHYGMSGGLGDTGMNYLVAARKVENANGTKTSPWLVNVSRSLGGGALLIFEHGNNDDGNSGKSRVGLHVTF